MTSPLKTLSTPRLPEQVRRTMRTGQANDPVARQYLPDARESNILPYESPDPIGDEAHTPVKGIVHRYPDRALIKLTDTCAAYCRFCFRKDMVGQGDGVLTDKEWTAALAYLQERTDIREVILTGGDPLTLSNRRLSDVLRDLMAIDHLDWVRIHTRTPMIKPERVDDALCTLISSCPKPVYIVLHVNHTQEIDDTVQAAFAKLHRAGASLLSQTVLLKGVNDDAYTLEKLFVTLLRNRVKPYYLHHPDLAPGTSHFRVSIKEGQDIIKALQGKISGLALPSYVLDVPGGYGKMPIGPCYLEQNDADTYVVEDYKGGKHLYPPSPANRTQA